MKMEERKLKVCSPESKGRFTYTEQLFTLDPDWYIFMQMKDPILHSLIGPNGTVLIGQNLDL